MNRECRVAPVLNQPQNLTGDFVELSRATAGTREAPLTLAARQLFLHQDQADRILAATAQAFGLTLATADERLLSLGEIRTLANR